MANDDVVLRVTGLKKDFGKTHALQNLNLECRSGTVHTIFGENGSGKTTFLKILSGILWPSGGVISFKDFPITRFVPHVAQNLGIFAVFQEILIAPERSVFDNIFLGYDRLLSVRRDLSRVRRFAMAHDLLSKLSNEPVDLDGKAGAQPLAVKQIVVLARALIRNPGILLLDESTSALDIDKRNLLFDVIRDQIAQGKLVIFISHRIDEVMEISDFVTVLNSGYSVSTIPRRDLSPSSLLEAISMEITSNDEQDCS